jgi:opacity protein-like surface antigen
MNSYMGTLEVSSSLRRKKMPSCKGGSKKTRLAVHLESGCFERDTPVTKKILLFAALLLLPTISRAQVVPSARGGNQQLYVGALFGDFDPDYGWQRLYSIGAFGDYNLTPKLGAEAEVRFHRFNQLADIHMDTYVAGPKYNFHRRRYTLYGKALFGLGSFNFPGNAAHGTYFAMAFGGGVDYRLTRRFYVRGEYEYQIWPGFVGPPDPPYVPLEDRPHGLTPNGFSFGTSYRFF